MVRERLRCWSCGSRQVFWRQTLSPWHRLRVSGAYVCDVCGAAGDRADFLADGDVSVWELVTHEYEGE